MKLSEVQKIKDMLYDASRIRHLCMMEDYESCQMKLDVSMLEPLEKQRMLELVKSFYIERFERAKRAAEEIGLEIDTETGTLP